MPKPSPRRILFLCTGNSCRSQMAEGWTRVLRARELEPYSAGLEARGLDPRAVAVMAEAGVDIRGQHSKTLAELTATLADPLAGQVAGPKGGQVDGRMDHGAPGRTSPPLFDEVVTVCDHARESCPLPPPGARLTHAGFDDPPRLAVGAAGEEAALAPYRRVRDEIRAFVERLPTGAGEPGAGGS